MKIKHYHCENNACDFHVRQKKKKVPPPRDRWKIVACALGEGGFIRNTYCPHCKWELKVNLFDEDKAIKVDEPKVSAIQLLKAISPNAK